MYFSSLTLQVFAFHFLYMYVYVRQCALSFDCDQAVSGAASCPPAAQRHSYSSATPKYSQSPRVHVLRSLKKTVTVLQWLSFVVP